MMGLEVLPNEVLIDYAGDSYDSPGDLYQTARTEILRRLENTVPDGCVAVRREDLARAIELIRYHSPNQAFGCVGRLRAALAEREKE